MATTTAIGRIQRKRVAIDESDIEGLRQQLRWMSNPELLLFGVTTKCLCSLETSPDNHRQEKSLYSSWKRGKSGRDETRACR